ncbi:MAG TPA: ribosome recycling factor [Candidatus Bathyarchaeia archaeon]|nr:ribosome recycling factor [Candidatus Bathyarchaeia archaeon]
MLEEIVDHGKKELGQVLELVVDDLKGVKTGRAKPSLIEDVKVQVYETTMVLRELASISAPDPHTLIVSPWDKNIINNLEKAIATSGLNLHPMVDNDFLRIQIPALTEETRQDLVKLVAQKIESGRRLIRQVRTETKKKIDEQKGQPGVSEDDLHHWEEELQKLVDDFIEKIEGLGKTKEEELMKI